MKFRKRLRDLGFLLGTGLFLIGAPPCGSTGPQTPKTGADGSTAAATQDSDKREGDKGEMTVGGFEAGNPGQREGGFEAGNPAPALLTVVTGQFGVPCPVEKVVFVDPKVFHDEAKVGPDCSFKKEFEGSKDLILAPVAVAPEGQWASFNLNDDGEAFSNFKAGSETDIGKNLLFDTTKTTIEPTNPTALGGKEVKLDSLFGLYKPGSLQDRSRLPNRSFCPDPKFHEGVTIEIKPWDRIKNPILGGAVGGEPEGTVEMIISGQYLFDDGLSAAKQSREQKDVFRGTMEAGFLRVSGSTKRAPSPSEYFLYNVHCDGWIESKEGGPPESFTLEGSCYYSPNGPDKTDAGSCYFRDFKKVKSYK